MIAFPSFPSGAPDRRPSSQPPSSERSSNPPPFDKQEDSVPPDSYDQMVQDWREHFDAPPSTPQTQRMPQSEGGERSADSLEEVWDSQADPAIETEWHAQGGTRVEGDRRMPPFANSFFTDDELEEEDGQKGGRDVA